MSIVIRPDPRVFRRSMPLVVVFGAYRRFDSEVPMREADVSKITGVVALARRFRAPLAFSRVVDDMDVSPAGTWLPECRPKVMDRVFNHLTGTAFANSEFSGVFRGITQREICFVGPEGDSDLETTFGDAQGHNRDARLVTPESMLQFCSASPAKSPQDHHIATNCNHHLDRTLSKGRGALRLVENF